jgi:hypothetical protein
MWSILTLASNFNSSNGQPDNRGPVDRAAG